MDYDIYYDGEQLITWLKDMQTMCTAIENNVSIIYAEIANMGNGWGGSSYQAYKKDCDDHRRYFDSIRDLVDIFKWGIEQQFDLDIVDAQLQLIDAATEELE